MAQRIVGRILGAGVLAATLSLAGPSRADARDFQGPADAWQWLTRAWQSGVSELWSWSSSLTLGSQAACTNPDGSPCQDNSTAGNSGDQGLGCDPDG